MLYIYICSLSYDSSACTYIYDPYTCMCVYSNSQCTPSCTHVLIIVFPLHLDIVHNYNTMYIDSVVSSREFLAGHI